MELTVFSLKGIIYKGEIESLNVKTASGEITVLKNHRPLITIIKKGKLVIVDAKGLRQEIAAKEGFLEVQPGNKASVILS